MANQQFLDSATQLPFYHRPIIHNSGMPQLFVVGYAQDHSRFVMDVWHISLVSHVIGSSHSYFAILGKAMIRGRPQVYMDKDKGIIVDTGTWNTMLHAFFETHMMLFIPWICLLSFICLEAPCRHNFMNATQTPHTWAFWAVHPSIYKLATMVYHDCTTTASIP